MSYIEKLLHTIVPHEKNRNIPHVLKAEFVGMLSLLVMALFFINQNNFYLIRQLNLTGAIYPAVLTDLTNQDRASLGFSNLTWSKTLEMAAEMKANDMVQNGYFAHTSPAGLTPWYWLEKAKYNFIYAGENLALDFTESADVERAWLNSPTHRANVLSTNYSEIGIMALDGNYQGRNTTFVVEFFGKPQAVKVPSTNTVKEKTPVVPKTLATSIPEVAGASIQNTAKPQTPIKVLQETNKTTEKFISVQNLEAAEPVIENSSVYQSKLSTWYQRLAVSPTNAIMAVYSTILGLVLLAMGLVLSKEYQRHHTKHLVMGMLLVVLTGIFLYSLQSPSAIYASIVF
jgi:hypothetical protein